MNLLLDTHALLWWMADDARLTRAARGAIASPGATVFVSAASALEIATKFRIGKLPGVRRLAEQFEAEMEAEGFKPLAISLGHAQLAGNLAIANRDPFDRLLIAQAILEQMVLVSNEAGFEVAGALRVW